MSNSKFIITELYWERIQLHVKGKIENISLENYTFSFRTLTDEFHFSPTGIKLEGNTFDLRFNIAILMMGIIYQVGIISYPYITVKQRMKLLPNRLLNYINFQKMKIF